jgi:hypothetical protein
VRIVEVLPPSPRESCYRYRVRVEDGRELSSYLTYLIPTRGGSAAVRDMLLVDDDDADRVAQDLIEGAGLRSEYVGLTRRLKEHRRESGRGAVRVLKSVVNEVHEGELAHLRSVAVGVHRFGPVPVLVLPQEHRIRVGGGERPVRLGVYPRTEARAHGARTGFPAGATGQPLLLRSLEVGLPLMIKRYFEDVAELFFDIEHHSSLSEVYRNAREVEHILGSSIGSKVALLERPPRLPANQTAVDEAATRIRERYPRLVLTTQFSRRFALFMLNELYRLVGVSVESERYAEGLARMQADANVEEVAAENDKFRRLLEAYRAYQANQQIEVSEGALDPPSGEATWQDRFVAFARFLSYLRRISQGAPLGSARVFFSGQHNVPTTEAVKRLVGRMADEEFPRQLVVLEQRESYPKDKTDVRLNVRSKIWLSDATHSFLPSDPERLDATDADYHWIAREAEHSLLLRREVAYFAHQPGGDAVYGQYVEGLSTLDFLSPEARAAEGERIERLRKHFRDAFPIRFRVEDAERLDENVRGYMNEKIGVLRSGRLLTILTGVLNQFGNADAARIAALDRETHRYPATKNQIGNAVFKDVPHANRKKRVDALIKAVARRAVSVEGVDYPFVVSFGARRDRPPTYQGALGTIIAAIAPDFTPAQVAAVRERVWEHYAQRYARGK